METYFNGTNLRTYCNTVLLEGAITSLLTPPPMKPRVESSSRITHGKNIITLGAKKDAREVSLTFAIRGADASEFDANYSKFVNLLTADGMIVLKTDRQPSVSYRFVYDSCSTISGFTSGRCLAKIQVKFIEPNPNNR